MRPLLLKVKRQGGSIMPWGGCFIASDPGHIVGIKGTMKKEEDKATLERNLQRSGRNLQLGR